MKNINSKSSVLCTLLFVALLSMFFLNCSDHDDDDAGVRICNMDNHEYDIELRRYSDDSVEGRMHLGEWYDLADHCDSFKHIDEGRYYLVVLDGDHIEDESDDFYLDEGELKVFIIDASGDIAFDFHGDDESLVRVCNSDDNDYRVELKRSSDDGVVTDFDLEPGDSFSDQCDTFYDLDNDSYYIEIYEAGNNIAVDRSNDFFIESYHSLRRTITRDGYLVD